MRNKVLVLGSDTTTFLSVIRSLGRKGHEVHTVSILTDTPALSSRYITQKHTINQYKPDNSTWAEDFERLLMNEKFDLVIPCSDPVIIPIQLERERFEKIALIYLLADQVVDVASNKLKSHELAKKLDIPVAACITVSNVEEALNALSLLSKPWVFKPDVSFSASNMNENNMVEKAFTRQQAELLARKFSKRGLFQIQQNFIGNGTGVEVLCSNGDILLSFQHLRIHEPMHGGGSSYRKGIPVHEGMLEATRKIMKVLRYTGVAMVEFKWNQAEDTWIFIEINARFWGSLPLAIASGADFPGALVETLLRGQKSFAYQIRNDLFCRNLTSDFQWLLANARADRSDPFLSSLPWKDVISEVINMFTGKERWDTLALDDPMPFIIELKRLFSAKLESLKNRIVVYGLTNIIARKIRQRRLKKILHSARTIIFVCYGNICRSPFAERVAIDSGLKISILSSGFHEVVGRPSPNDAIEAAIHYGVNLQNHRSNRITQLEIDKSDLLFIFDIDNYKRMIRDFPEVTSKLYLLSDIDLNIPAVISDPYGHVLTAYDEVYQKIRDCIEILVHLKDGDKTVSL